MRFLCLPVLLSACAAFASARVIVQQIPEISDIFAPASSDITDWLSRQVPFSATRILAHINADGAIVAGAAPPFDTSKDHYQWYWVRDGGLVMKALAEYYAVSKSPEIPEKFGRFLAWTRKTQEEARKSSLKPKLHNVGNHLFKEAQGWTRFSLKGIPDPDWMSPQYDGPALRALAFMTFANAEPDVAPLYYDPKDATSVVKTDLDAVVNSWGETDGYEPWEEVVGQHFFDYIVQYRALVVGAEFAARLGDKVGAEKYEAVSKQIKVKLDDFWNGKFLQSSLNGARNGGDNEGAAMKISQGYYVDVTTVLGVNHGADNTTYPASNPKSQASVYALISAFLYDEYKPKKILSDWSLNKQDVEFNGLPMNPGIGRYAEDIFDGEGYKYPDPKDPKKANVSKGAGFWFLATLSMAEFLYCAVEQYTALGEILITPENQKFWTFLGLDFSEGDKVGLGNELFHRAIAHLIEHGDRFMRRASKYVKEDGYMAEQFHFRTGEQMSTKDLAWSYASVLSAHVYREKARAELNKVSTAYIKSEVGNGAGSTYPLYISFYAFTSVFMLQIPRWLFQ